MNGTSFNAARPPNVTVGTTNGGILHYLTIVSSPNYNKTTIQCFAFPVDEQIPDETPSVFLIVQGM